MTRARDIANFGDGIATADIDDGAVTAAKLASGAGGKVLQVVSASIGSSSGTATFPFDNTAPQINEGFEIVSGSITPSSASNKIIITATFVMDKYQNGSGAAALFDGSSDAIYAVTKTTSEDGNPTPISMSYLDSPNTTSSVTYSIRCGSNGGSTMWINNTNFGQRFNGRLNGSFILMEIAG